MELLLCFAALLVGGVGGFFVGRVSPEMRQTVESAVFRQPRDNRLKRQYLNFLNYDGTERGQYSLEDRN